MDGHWKKKKKGSSQDLLFNSALPLYTFYFPANINVID
jgi:hypothetical protein